MQTAAQPGWRGDLAAITFGMAGLLMLGLQPILLEQLILAKYCSLDEAGLIAMAEIVAIGVGAAASNGLVPLRGLRMTATLATLLLGAVNACTPLASTLLPLLLARVMAGLAGGVLVWIATQAIVRFSAPERLAGLFLLLQSCGQAAAAFTLAIGAIPAAGLRGGFNALALLSLTPLLLVLWLPSQFTPHTSKELGLPPLSRPVVLAALSIAFDMAVVGALWTFLETLGRTAQLPSRPVQLTITSVLLSQIAGAVCASWLSPRLNAKRTLVGGNVLLLLAGVAYLLLPPGNLIWFILTCTAFGFLWLFMMPLHVKLAFSADPQGRLAVQVPALQLMGSALGPLTASLFMKGDTDVRPAYVAGAVYAAAALGLVLLFSPASSRKLA
jgi:MFS transporter, DHA1 family, inner membrane transport protein